MRTHKNNVGIIGAGIGGMTTALALDQAGFEATVYERAPELREAGAGMMLWPNATHCAPQVCSKLWRNQVERAHASSFAPAAAGFS
jgi:2-polyprenyl-6-methoxyphenol hydroxylase-like FAD-dependent oxidoreductase